MKLTVRADGRVESTRSLELKKGDFVREHVNLEAVPRPRPRRRIAMEAPADATVPAVVQQPVDAQQGPGAEDSPPFYGRWWFWTIVGAAVIGGAATGYVLTRPAACPTETCL